MAKYDLTDSEWERVAPLMPPQQTRKKGRPPKDHRMMLNAMLWLVRSGVEWQDLPERYRSWKTVYTRYHLWKNSGLLHKVFSELKADDGNNNFNVDI